MAAFLNKRSNVINAIERAADDMHEAIAELRQVWDRERDGKWRLDRAELDVEMFLEDLYVELGRATSIDDLDDHQRWLAHDAHDRTLRLVAVLREITEALGCDYEEAERARAATCAVLDAMRPLVSLSDHGVRLTSVEGVPLARVLAWVSGRAAEPTAADGDPRKAGQLGDLRSLDARL